MIIEKGENEWKGSKLEPYSQMIEKELKKEKMELEYDMMADGWLLSQSIHYIIYTSTMNSFDDGSLLLNISTKPTSNTTSNNNKLLIKKQKYQRKLQ